MAESAKETVVTESTEKLKRFVKPKVELRGSDSSLRNTLLSEDSDCDSGPEAKSFEQAPLLQSVDNFAEFKNNFFTELDRRSAIERLRKSEPSITTDDLLESKN